MDDCKKAGLKTLLASENRAQEPVPGTVAAEQLPLIPLSQVSNAQTGAEISVPSGQGAGLPGRPAGSRNKRTQEWADYILGRHHPPLLTLAETYDQPLLDFARELGYLVDDPALPKDQHRRPTPGELLELKKVQLQCARELAPYIHSKQPIGVDTGGSGLLQLIINSGQHSASDFQQAGNMPVSFIDVTPQQNQDVSGDESGNSDVDASNASGKAQQTQGNDGE